MGKTGSVRSRSFIVPFWCCSAYDDKTPEEVVQQKSFYFLWQKNVLACTWLKGLVAAAVTSQRWPAALHDTMHVTHRTLYVA